MIRFRTLATVDLRDSQGRELRSVLRRPKLLALLSYLAVARPRGFHRRDTLVALLWPELDNAHARNALRQAVHSLRDALGNDAIVGRSDEELAVNTEQLWCDVVEFHTALDADEPQRGIELYAGPLLAGLHIPDVPEFERWLDEEREHVRRRACDATESLVKRAIESGNPTGAARWAQRLTELSPLDESAVRRLMELLDRSGDRASAVHAYEEFERRLQRELELGPSSQTHALVQNIRSRQHHEAVSTIAHGAQPPTRGEKVNVDGEASASPDAPGHASVGTDDEKARLTIGAGLRPVPRRLPSTRVTALLAVLIAALITAGWMIFRAPDRALNAAGKEGTSSIVVLPFSNLGPAEDAYFADGMTEEVAARLAAVDRFRIIGNSSARQYATTRKSSREIGRDGVDYVLEGSIRWQKSRAGPDRVRVTTQLVNTKDGTNLWVHVYDEPYDEIIRVQTDIAQKVVSALNVQLLEKERRVVVDTPTRNLAAYDFYLRGMDYRRRGTNDINSPAAQLMFEKAIALDPEFALAYANLSRVHTLAYWNSLDHSPQRLAQARMTAERALELEPTLGNAHGSLALYYGLGRREYDSAMREFAIAESAGFDAFLGKATVLLREGKVRESLTYYEGARKNDPTSTVAASNSGQPYAMLREYSKAEELFDRSIALAPDRANGYLLQFWNYLQWDGNTRRARPVMEAAQRAGVDDQPGVVYARVLMEIFDRRYDKALSLLAAEAPEITLSDHLRVVPRAQLYAFVYSLQQRQALARAHYDSSRRILYRKVQQDPQDPRLHTALGIAYAGVGQKQQAISEGLKAIELAPISDELMKGYHVMWEVARIYMMVGEQDIAISRLEYLLSIPGHLSAAWLRMDPVWDPLRTNPRFQRLVAQGK